MPIINFDQFAECFAGDAELEREIIEIFFKTGMESVRILESAIKSRDSARIASEAHKLKGSCLALGADTLARLCETIQEGAKTSSPACLCGFVELARVNFATLHDVLIVRNGELRGSIRRVA